MEKHHQHEGVHNYFVYKMGEMKTALQDAINSLEALKGIFMKSQQHGNCFYIIQGEKLFCAGKMVDDLVFYFYYKNVYENSFMAKW